MSWKPTYRTERTTTTWATWTPREATAPGDAWQKKAWAFLTGRGLHPGTIERAGLGCNMTDAWEGRESWGLPPETTDKGKAKKVWLPGGLVIPCLPGGRVIRLRVRRPDPGDGPPFVIMPGSASSPLTLGQGRAWVVVESELCGLLIHQEAGDLVGVVALGSAQARPDAETDRTLKADDL